MPRYTTVDSLIKRGFKRFSDPADIMRTIEDYSSLIDAYTDQYFGPRRLKFSNIIMSDWSKIIDLPQRIPIIHIDKIEYSGTRSNNFITLSSEDYFAQQRKIILSKGLYHQSPELELQSSIDGRYPSFKFNVDGIFGWVEERDFFETTCNHQINQQSTSAVLESTEGIYPKDYILINDKYQILVDTVDDATQTITFDAIRDIKTIASGSKFVVYGKLLKDIETAAIQLCMASKKLESHIGGRIKYEKIDRYSYVNELTTTGVATVDQILSSYQAPLYVGFV